MTVVVAELFGGVLDATTAQVLLAVTLLGVAMGVIGCFSVLRGQSLLGDALAHCTLPGLCVGFMVNVAWGNDARGIGLPLGALSSGLLAVGLVHWLTTRTRLPQDAAIASVLGGGFAVGVLLLSALQHWPTTGQAGLQQFLFGQAAGLTHEEFGRIAVASAVALVVAVGGWRRFGMTLFDATFAQLQGQPVRYFQGVMAALAALLTVVALPAVGLVMAVALLVTPAITARLWVTRLGPLGVLAGLVGGLAAALGVLWSRFGGVPTGAAVVLVATLLFFASLLLSPQRGVVAGRWRRWRQRRRWLHQLQSANAPILPPVDAPS